MLLISTAQPFTGGVTIVAGTGREYTCSFTGVWAVGDAFALIFTQTVGGAQLTIGDGYVSGVMPSFIFAYGNKLMALGGSTVYFTTQGSGTTWNDVTADNNGFVEITNFYSTPEPLLAMAPFQGRMAFFSRNTIQIWDVPADPANWAQGQVMPDIGTFAINSVKAQGDKDVYFLSDTGIRSLQVRTATNNAVIDDVGSPIDILVQTKLESASAGEKAAACGIIEPSTKRYWLFLKDTIYVLSAFQSSKILAWSTYAPTYQNGLAQTAFTPSKFVVYNGQVYCRDANSFYLYGGAAGTTYDSVIPTVETPYLDGKKPGTRKNGKGIDAIFTGPWTIYASMDPKTDNQNPCFLYNEASTYNEVIPYTDTGFHFKLKAVGSGNTAAKLSSFIFHFDEGEEK